ncbi:MAG TPA: hypothetical protein VHE78_12675 [Gemmatimonadaceae bacterium]|nr:hypothetical protein [Gemmatimonadaceae bacterium]
MRPNHLRAREADADGAALQLAADEVVTLYGNGGEPVESVRLVTPSGTRTVRPEPRPQEPPRRFASATMNTLANAAPLDEWRELIAREAKLVEELLAVAQERVRLEVHLKCAGHNLSAIVARDEGDPARL